MDQLTLPSLMGILPVLPTPFQDGGAVDVNAMARVVQFAIDAGVSGVVYPGFASEVETLSAAERAALLTIVNDVAGERIPVIAGVSAGSVRDIIGHARQAQQLGISRMMIQPPKSIGDGSEAVTNLLASVCEQLPDAEFILQNAPAPRGADLTPETILDIVGQLPAIKYVKEETLPSGPAISRVLLAPPPHLEGFIGGGGARYIIDEYERGACAAMPALEIADYHVALDRAYRSGDKSLARGLYIKSLPLLLLQAVYRMRLTKHVLTRRGVLNNAVVRAPTPELDEIAVADIDRCFDEIESAVARGTHR